MTVDIHRITAEIAERGYTTEADGAAFREYFSRPAPAEDVPAHLRFLLEPEAIEDAKSFMAAMRDLAWSAMRDPLAFVEKMFIAPMAQKWPAVAAADVAVGGLITEGLRRIAVDWRTVGHFRVGGWMAAGHPQKLETECLFVIGYGGRRRHVEFAEDAPDRLLVKASDEACDRDAPEFEGGEMTARPAAVVRESFDDDCPF